MSAQEAMDQLRTIATEIDKRSRELAQVQRELEPLTEQYDDFIAGYEQDLWEKHIAGAKLPPAELRAQMARQAMPSEFAKQYRMLIQRRERLRKRIGDLKSASDSWRSVLSAEKVEAEAIR